MPVYEYVCTSCGRRIDVRHSIAENGPTTCETCGGRMRKALSTPAIHFKGSGWAKKDAHSAARSGEKKAAGEGTTESTPVTAGADGSSSGAEGSSSDGDGSSSGAERSSTGAEASSPAGDSAKSATKAESRSASQGSGSSSSARGGSKSSRSSGKKSSD